MCSTNICTYFQGQIRFLSNSSFLDRNKFNHVVRKYGGDKYVKHFTCWNQLLCLMFSLLSNRVSLRDLIVALEAHRRKLYHLGLGKNVSKTTLAKSNQDREYRIFEEYAYFLVDEAQRKRATNIFKLGGNVYAFDSSTIDLYLNGYWWTKSRKKKSGIKVHTLYDVETQIPKFFHFTEVRVHDSKAMKKIPYESNAYYILNRSYNDVKSLYHIHLVEAKFVFRAKKNLKFKTFKWRRKFPKNVLPDAIVELTGYYPQKNYPEQFRIVKYWDENKNVSSFSSQMRWIYPLFRWLNFIRTDGRLSSFSSGSSST